MKIFRSQESVRVRQAMALAALLISAAFVAGCNIITPLVYLTSPEPTVPAAFVLEDKPTVVFVDDRRNVVSPISLRRSIAETVTQSLMQNDVLTSMISSRDAMALAAGTDKHESLMSVGDIAKAVGAEQIIYVEMVTFSPSPDGVTPRALATAKLRVLDVEQQRRIVPPAEDPETFFPIKVVTDEVDPKMYRSRATLRKLMQQLAAQMGDTVAKLFYEHKPDDALGARLGQSN